MKVVVCIDSSKGSLGSVEAGRAAAAGIRRVFPDAACVVRPLADGGEGTVAALVEGLGGELKSVEVTGPAGKPVVAKYGCSEIGRIAEGKARALNFWGDVQETPAAQNGIMPP